MRSWLERRIYDLSYFLVHWMFLFLLSFRWFGRRNLPQKGPVILLANHQSFIDPVIVGLAAGRYLSYLARQTLFKNWLFAFLIRTYQAIPIDHKGFAREGITSTLAALQQGKAVLMFPEGERTHDGAVHPFKPGIWLLLKKISCPIVPVGIAGAYGCWNRFAKFPRPSFLFLGPNDADIVVNIGPAIMPAELLKLDREQALERLYHAVNEAHKKAESLRKKRRES
ncbi:MAG: 1-acyl-sn-glycerol-3-phosphate acyltransferase [Gemmataceae bacterium]|jgi:1-acyl-sn-glycerol-3-phosphate acyltransferase|nr:1-acyl-sn-glycerol-3-phosphate acyltransferase [Gemmataceae bacterium]